MMNFFKAMLWRNNAVKAVKALFEDLRQEADDRRLRKQHEIYREVCDLADAYDKELPTYDGYIEYKGECVYESNWGDPYNRYDATNAKNTAELLMWERVRAKYGSKKVDVSIIHTPYPWNDPWTIHYMCRNMMNRFEHWRLYYKVNEEANQNRQN